MARPISINEDVVRKLEDAFSDGANVTEACFITDISRDIYYRYLSVDNEFSYRMDKAQLSLHSKAKANIARLVKKGDINASKWLVDNGPINLSLPRDAVKQGDIVPKWLDEPGVIVMAKDTLVDGFKAIAEATIKGNLFKGAEPLDRSFVAAYEGLTVDEQFEEAVKYFSRQTNLSWFIEMSLNAALILTQKKQPPLRYYVSED